jgi:hypothetical protein
MRTLLRAGVTTLAASSMLLAGTTAAMAAPAGGVTITVGPLILEPGTYGHTGSIRVAVRNGTSEPLSGGFTVTEPLPATTGAIEGASACPLGSTPDNRTISYCELDSAIAPGRTGVVTVRFQSPAKPQPYAEIAPQVGTIEVAGVTTDFSALFRSTTGSLRHPQPYVQDTTAALTVTAGDVTLTRQDDGSLSGRVPVTVHNNGDAPHSYVDAAVAVPAGVDGWPAIDPGDACVGTDSLPTPPGGNAIVCGAGGQLAEGETRTFDWVITAPAETPAGPLGTGTTLVRLHEPAAVQTDSANNHTFTITVTQ